MWITAYVLPDRSEGGRLMRYDDRREVYRDCRWCQGKGCLYCKAEADKAYKAADGPKLIASFDTSTPEGVEAAKSGIRQILAEHGVLPKNGAEP